MLYKLGTAEGSIAKSFVVGAVVMKGEPDGVRDGEGVRT